MCIITWPTGAHDYSLEPSKLTDVPHEIILSVGFVAGLKSQNMVLSGDIRSIPLLSEVCIFFDMAGPDW